MTETAPPAAPRTVPTAPAAGGVPRWSRYVAVGDSFTEGMWDRDAQDPELCRGWADRLAVHLSSARTEAGAEPLRYANLAIRGKLLGPILDEQLPRALELGADLVSIVGGGNDVLRPRVDPDALADRVERAVAQARAAGADVLLSTGFSVGEGALTFTRGRVGGYNATLWSIARRHGAYVMDPWGMRSLQDWRMWSEDRIHLTSEGHRRVAQAALVGLGLTPTDPDWDEPLPPRARPALAERARQDARWAREFVGPWIGRRLTGRSSGDGRTAKYPELAEVRPVDR